MTLRSHSRTHGQQERTRTRHRARPTPPSPTDLLDILLLADRFQIDSAVGMCSNMLCKDLTVDAAARYLVLPESLALNDTCRELMLKSRTCLSRHFQVFFSFVSRISNSGFECPACIVRFSGLFPSLSPFWELSLLSIVFVSFCVIE